MHKIWVFWLIQIYRNPFRKNIFWKCIKGALLTSMHCAPGLAILSNVSAESQLRQIGWLYGFHKESVNDENNVNICCCSSLCTQFVEILFEKPLVIMSLKRLFIGWISRWLFSLVEWLHTDLFAIWGINLYL